MNVLGYRKRRLTKGRGAPADKVNKMTPTFICMNSSVTLVHANYCRPHHQTIMPSITILYFASIRTCLGIERESIALPLTPHDESRIADLPSAVARLHPENADKLGKILEGCMWSVNEEMVDLEDAEESSKVLQGGEVVAIIPPVSGG